MLLTDRLRHRRHHERRPRHLSRRSLERRGWRRWSRGRSWSRRRRGWSSWCGGSCHRRWSRHDGHWRRKGRLRSKSKSERVTDRYRHGHVLDRRLRRWRSRSARRSRRGRHRPIERRVVRKRRWWRLKLSSIGLTRQTHALDRLLLFAVLLVVLLAVLLVVVLLVRLRRRRSARRSWSWRLGRGSRSWRCGSGRWWRWSRRGRCSWHRRSSRHRSHRHRPAHPAHAHAHHAAHGPAGQSGPSVSARTSERACAGQCIRHRQRAHIGGGGSMIALIRSARPPRRVSGHWVRH